ncbi:intersectin-1 isoform X3 [Halyomorpha halys]|uniref:intersectin-1 isoform X3 n=1 Tax=Halyomorpha halys TaxID=286706 RepID=UPI0034D227A7
MMDPYIITPAERARFEQQFNALKPINGIVTGEQAKGLLLQSQLPPAILGVIWALADTDADGKMNINEFSIACKLINLKLRGFDLPKALPPALKSLVEHPPPSVQSKPPIPPLPNSGLLMMANEPPSSQPSALAKAISPPSGRPSPVTSPPLVGGPPPKPPQPLLPPQPATQIQPLISTQPQLPIMQAKPPQTIIPSQLPLQTAPLIPGIPVVPSQPGMTPMPIPSQPGMTPMPPVGSAGLASVMQPGIPPVASIPSVPSVGMAPLPPAVNQVGISGMPASLASQSSIPAVSSTIQSGFGSLAGQPSLTTSQIGISSAMVPPTSLSGLTTTQSSPPTQPTPPTPPIAVTTTQSSIERVLSLDSPRNLLYYYETSRRLGSSSPLVEWAVPQASKLKYTQLFNTTDKARSGYLTGPQARTILLASKLPQPVLAQIWALADTDADGRLSCEEFVLALHLCDLARAGETLPTSLPPNLVPPTLRRVRNNSLTSSEQGDLSATGINQVSFEDKRKENFEKGQAELDRRRKALLEIQRKEQEERERKEREEREKQEKIRLEQEKKRQEEFERQLEKQREIEKAKEEERRRAQEQREAARKEMERQRQLEWEKQRLQELQTQRQKQQELVLSLKAKSQALTIELSQKEDKVKELSKQISETRCGVTSVKSVIDGMRVSRDQNLAEYNRLKAVIKQRNAQTLALSQQKAKLEAAGKLGKEEKEKEQAAFDDKTLIIKNLKDKLKDMEEQATQKEIDVENNNSQLEKLKDELSALLKNCEDLYSAYDEKRNNYLKLKGLNKPSVINNDDAWGTSAWDSTPSSAAWPDETQETPGYSRYRALYEFVARNSDELSFQPGDTILVPINQNAEPGWMSGELRGQTGWFPETYVEPLSGFNGSSEIISTSIAPKTPLEGIVEVAESDTGSVIEEGPSLPTGLNPILGLGKAVDMVARAAYTFSATQGSQLSFLKGDLISVSEIQDQWCYGQVNLAEGWFPKSYVVFEETAPVVSTIPPTVQETTGVGDYYISLYPYQSDEAGDLTFDQGEVILVIGKDGDWWTGQIGDRSGIFPSNYVQTYEVSSQNTQFNSQPVEEPKKEPITVEEPVIEKKVSPVTAEPPPVQNVNEGSKVVTPDFSTLSSQGGKSRKPLIATVIVPYQATSKEQLSLQRGQLIMIRKKTTTGWWEGELQAKGKKRQIGWFPASYVKLLGASGKASQPQSRKSSESGLTDTLLERVVALYQYTAQNEDELSFEKGDIVTVLAKDEPSWWKGELNGAVGLFPSNYVAPQCENGPSKKNFVPKEDKRQQHIKELIITEQAYIDDMSIVYDVFERPLIESRLLTNEQLRTIFINWHDILECNYSFLRALRVRRDMSKGGIIRTIGDILCENLPRMRVYVRFCGCQLRAAAMLQTLSETNKDFSALAKRCQSDPRTKGLPLSSFLIKPMQRITKYPLLISKILEYTPKEHSDRQNLEEALQKAEDLCSQVNEGVREKENSERLEWLQSHVLSDRLSEPLIFNSLTNAVGPRKFLHFSALTKTKSGKELIGFLMNDFLLLAQPNRPLGGQFSFERHQNVLFRIYKQPLLLSDLNIVGSIGEPNGVEFRLEYNKTIFNLSATSHNEKNLWLKKLTLAQNELKEHERDKLRRQQSKQASFGAVGRILVFVMEGSKLKITTVRKRPPKCMLKLIIMKGRFLEPSSFRGVHREVFCEVSMGSQESRTPAVPTPNGSDPKWNTSMQFLVKDLQEDVLCLTVKDKGNFSPDEFLGRTELCVSDILSAIRSQGHGPITKVLKLHEVRSGEVTLKLDVHLFNSV